MIAQLTGILSHKGPESVIVNVQGMGYEVFISRLTLERLPSAGEEVSLFIYTHVNEGAFLLFGFLSGTDKTLFKKLISVSGVGPKLANQVMSGLSSGELVNAILGENLVKLTGISGIGKKTAERLIVELKDKMLAFADQLVPMDLAPRTRSVPNTLYDEALSALVNLGYTRPLAERALAQVAIRAESTIEEILKGSLGVLGK